MLTLIKTQNLVYSSKAIGWFLGVTLGIMFLIGVAILVLDVQINTPIHYALYVVGLLSPFLGTVAYYYITTGSIRTMKSMLFPMRLGLGAIMIIIVPFFSLISFSIASLFGLPFRWDLLPPIYSLFMAFAGWSSIIWLEEVAWRGTLLPVLQQQFSPVLSSILINLVWTLWHLPLLYLIGMSGPEMGLFSLQTLGMAFSMTWAYNRSGQVLVAVLIHGAYNATTGWLLAAIPSVAANDLIGLQAAGQLALGMLVLIFTRGRLGLSKQASARSNQHS